MHTHSLLIERQRIFIPIRLDVDAQTGLLLDMPGHPTKALRMRVNLQHIDRVAALEN